MRLRLLLACLLLVACGDDDDGSGGARDGGAGESGSSGVGGRSGSGAGRGGSGVGGKGGSGAGGNGGSSGRSGGGDAGSRAGTGGSGPAFGMIRLVPNVIAGVEPSTTSAGVGSAQYALRVGSPTASTLQSLKYYITSIQLCEHLELQGSGFSNPSGCIVLYENMPAGSPDYVEYTVEEAKSDETPGRFIDLMSAEGQAALRRPVSLRVPIAAPDAVADDDAGTAEDDGGTAELPSQRGVYRYGLINFYRPIKVKAEFPIIGEPGQYYRTKAVTKINSTPSSSGGTSTDRVEIGDTLSGATEETTYMLNNGGALFVFQKPFAITQADVDAQTEIKVDLVFNPDSFGQAYPMTDCETQPWISICDPTSEVAIDMPFVRMSPVPRKGSEKTRKETYLLDYDAASKLRVELYYNDGDPQAGIQGVDIALVYQPSAVNASVPSGNIVASNFVSQTGSVTSNDATVRLMDYRHETNLEGLVRRTDGTVTIHCQFTGSICPSLGTTTTRSYTYEGDTIVSAD